MLKQRRYWFLSRWATQITEKIRDRSLVSNRSAGAYLIDRFFAREENSCCDQKFESLQPGWSKRKKSPHAGQNWVLFRPKKKTRDERIPESAGLHIAEEEDSCRRRLKIPKKPRPLLLRAAVAEGGRALVLVLIPKLEREDDNLVL
ncbi:hypothetical protein AAC387_Pa07g1648 [Persea americana]